MAYMKIIFRSIIFLLLLIIAFFFIKNHFGLLETKASATIKNQTFYIDVVKEQKNKQIGLSTKNSITQNYGMYFPFEKSDYHAFWMKNMKFPIDIIFLQDDIVVSIFSNIPAPKSKNEALPFYQPTEPANAVLEISAGLSQKLDLKKGDKITFKNLPK
jgi:uncharacterized membrane protein (UPF0127 family)